MTTVDASHLSAIPFLDLANLDGRFLGTGTFYHEGKWRLWTPVATGLIELKILGPAEGLYFGSSSASEHDLFFHFLDFIAQRAAYPDVIHGYSGITDDIWNMTAVLAKIDLLHSMRKQVGTGISRMVTTELEYLFSVCRSIFDLLQEIIKRLWDKVILNDSDVSKKPLKKSFTEMVMHGGKVTTLDSLQTRFGLPAHLAGIYVHCAEFFMELRLIRDNLVHNGSPVQTIFSGDEGFFVAGHLRPFSKLTILRESERMPNDISPLSPAIAAVIHATLSSCEAFSRALEASFKLPPPLVPGMGLFMRCPFSARFAEAMNDYEERVDSIPKNGPAHYDSIRT